MNNSLEALITRLKAAAEKAAPGPYSIDHTGYSLKCSDGTFGDFLDMDNATFALEANPESVLEMVAALEQAQQRYDDEIVEKSRLAVALANANKRIADLETRPFLSAVIDDVCLAAAGIHCLGRGVDDDKAQEIIDSIRARLETINASQLSIKLPPRYSMLHRSDFNEEYQSVMAYKADDVIEAIRAAGGSLASSVGGGDA